MLSFFLLPLAIALPAIAVPTTSCKPKCPIIFDGRVPAGTPLSTFDGNVSNPFNPDFVHGQNLSWSEILELSSQSPSRFDGPDDTPLEVSITDESVFFIPPDNLQTGFRRAGLLFADDANEEEDPSDVDVVTFHWSVKQNAERYIDIDHEYLNVWHEASDFSANQWSFVAGQLIGKPASDPFLFRILGRENNVLFSVPIDPIDWQNFAVTMDSVADTLSVYYSSSLHPLEQVVAGASNDNSGRGQFQIGLLKKPLGDVEDVVHEGFQESGILESQIYGGIFVEDNKLGSCLSL